MMIRRGNKTRSGETEPQVSPPTGKARRAILAAPLLSAFVAVSATPAGSKEQAMAAASFKGKAAPVLVNASTDPGIAALIIDPNSLSRTALSAAVGDSTDPLGRNPVSGVFYARRYGFVEANTATQNAAAVVAAMGAMSRGDTLILPQGIFKVDPFVITKNIRIQGTNAPGFHAQYAYGDPRWLLPGVASGTVLHFSNTSGDAVTIPGTSSHNGTALQDLAIIGPGRGSSTGLFTGIRDVSPATGTQAGWPLRIRLTNVGIANFSQGWHTNCENSTFNGIYIVACGVGLSTFWPFNGNSFAGLNVEACTIHALKIMDSDTNTFTGGVIQGNAAEKVIYIGGTTSNHLFQGIYLENGHNSPHSEIWDLWIEGGVKNEFQRVRFGSQLVVNPGIHMGANARLNTLHVTNGPYRLRMEGNRNAFHGYVLRSVVDSGKGNIVQMVGAEHHDVLPVTSISASYTVSPGQGDRLIVAEAGVVINLPSVGIGVISKGMVVTVKAKNRACTLASGGVPIDASTTGLAIAAWGKVSVLYDGKQWITI
jgi:hypothetical protein